MFRLLARIFKKEPQFQWQEYSVPVYIPPEAREWVDAGIKYWDERARRGLEESVFGEEGARR